jgi:hypothetical protein
MSTLGVPNANLCNGARVPLSTLRKQIARVRKSSCLDLLGLLNFCSNRCIYICIPFQNTCQESPGGDTDVDTGIYEDWVTRRENTESITHPAAVHVREPAEGGPGGHTVLRQRAAPERPAHPPIHIATGFDSCARHFPETTGGIAGDGQHDPYPNAGFAAPEGMVSSGDRNRPTLPSTFSDARWATGVPAGTSLLGVGAEALATGSGRGELESGINRCRTYCRSCADTGLKHSLCGCAAPQSANLDGTTLIFKSQD